MTKLTYDNNKKRISHSKIATALSLRKLGEKTVWA